MMYRIGEFSKMSKTTIKTLRYYDETGLLKPEYVDCFSSYRFYTTNQLIQLHQIQSFRQAGLSIDEIKMILSGKAHTAILQARKTELMTQLEHIHEKLSAINFILSGQEEECFMKYQAIVKELPECVVYSKKMTVPGYDTYFQVIPQIGQEVTKRYPDLKCAVPEYCFIVYLDGEYKDRDINIEFCEAVEQMKPDFNDIHFKNIKSVRAVSVMHKGDYSGLSNAYAYAFKWIEENGYTVLEPPRENYIDGIWNKEEKEEWLTELQIPIEKV